MLEYVYKVYIDDFKVKLPPPLKMQSLVAFKDTFLVVMFILKFSNLLENIKTFNLYHFYQLFPTLKTDCGIILRNFDSTSVTETLGKVWRLILTNC